jgi:DNA polymerase I
VVVCVGGTSLKALGLEGRITTQRGRERWLTSDDLHAALCKGRAKRDLPALTWSDDWRDGGVYVLPTFHPAYALRNPDVFQDLVKDLERVAHLVKQAPAQHRTIPTPILHVPTNVPDALRWIGVVAQQRVVACDIENRSKDYPFDQWGDALLTVAYAWRQGGVLHALVLPAYKGPLVGPASWGRGDVDPSWGFPGRDVGQRRLVVDALRRLHLGRRPRITGWNLKYDAKHIRKALDFWLRIGGDGMLMHYLLDERRGIHGLKERASDDLGAADYEHEIAAYTGAGQNYDMGKVPFDKLAQYTAWDVAFSLDLTLGYEAQGREVDDGDPFWVYRHMLIPAARALAVVEYQGIEVDVPALRKLDKGIRRLLDGYVSEMREASGVPTLNPSSPAQLVQVLYGDAVRQQYGVDAKTANGLPTFALPVQLNDQGTPGTGADICDKLLAILRERGDAEDSPPARLVRSLGKHRLDAQLHRTYINKLPRIVNRDRRVWTNLNLHIARTGRLSSSDPVNLQNIPTRRKEGKQIKRAFRATTNQRVLQAWYAEKGLPFNPEPWQMWEVDMSQCELRTAAFVSGDPVMRAIYFEGRDFHHEMGTLLLGSEQLARELRPYVKTYIFAQLYGAEAKKLTQLLNDAAIEEESRSGKPQKRWVIAEVEALNRTFKGEFPVFHLWAERTRKEAFDTGQVRTLFRRRRRWGLITPQTVNDLNKESVNTVVQSPASDLVLIGLTRVVNWLHQSEAAQFEYNWHKLHPDLGRPLGRVLLSVHDSIIGESPQSHALPVARTVQHLLESIPAEFGIDVPYKADIKIGLNWGDLQEVKEAHA